MDEIREEPVCPSPSVPLPEGEGRAFAHCSVVVEVSVLARVSGNVGPLELDFVSHRGSARRSGVTDSESVAAMAFGKSNDWESDCCKSLVLRG